MKELEIKYPRQIDSDVNLLLAHDELRCTLLNDYNPGDTRIEIYDEYQKMDMFPPTGIITLTEQSSEIDKRALTFFYDNRDELWDGESFENLILFPGFVDVIKPKDITHVTLNVTAPHHNNIKDALIEVQKFMGIKGTEDITTLEGRVNYLTKIVLTPRAWFKVDKKMGLVPFTVTFTNQTFRLGEDPKYTWNFGDGSPLNIIEDPSEMVVEHTYVEPGKYDVTLTVTNAQGSDEIVFPGLITARVESPLEAVIEILPRSNQLPIPGDGTLDYGVRSSVNVPIDIRVKVGPNDSMVRRPMIDPAGPEYSYAGERLEDSSVVPPPPDDPISGIPVDPIEAYTWSLNDDIRHPNSARARALYSVGGLYDVILRTDTQLGAYRITTHKEVIDVVEDKNLWLWQFEDTTVGEDWDLSILGHGSTSDVFGYEFGLLSETFKLAGNPLTINRDDTFLDGTNGEKRAKKEFRRNVGFAQRGTTPSGRSGESMLYWASGGLPYSSQTIEMKRYNGFTDTYTDPENMPTSGQREHPWNWISLSTPSRSYFVFGSPSDTSPPNTNPSYQIKHMYDFFASAPDNMTATTLSLANYKGGAEELRHHPSNYDGGVPIDGHFASYRTAWKDNTGYILRNAGSGWAFRYGSFYRTEGVMPDLVMNFIKLPDMPGSVKVEGQLVSLANGVFFFNNTANIAAYNDAAGVWEIGGPSQASVSFSGLQDTLAPNFSLQENTLLASSDGVFNAYLSFDYSNNAFIKFNSQEATFSSLGSRPVGYQFMMGIF